MASTPITQVDVNGISAQVLIDGFDYGINENGPYRDVIYIVDGASGAKFCDSLLGIGTYSGTKMSLPSPHPYPNNENLKCQAAGLHELKGPAQPDEFLVGADQVAIKAHYGVTTWDAIGQDFQPFFDGYQVPWSHLSMEVGHEEYEPTDLAIPAAGAVISRLRVRVPTVTYTFRRTMIPDPVAYDTVCAAIVYKLNNGVFLGKAAETLRFDSFAMNEEDRDPSGLRVFTFTAMLTWRPISWNKVLKPGTTSTWVYPDSTGDYPYQTGDFRPLMTWGL